jgi:hypothetical protein
VGSQGFLDIGKTALYHGKLDKRFFDSPLNGENDKREYEPDNCKEKAD